MLYAITRTHRRNSWYLRTFLIAIVTSSPSYGVEETTTTSGDRRLCSCFVKWRRDVKGRWSFSVQYTATPFTVPKRREKKTTCRRHLSLKDTHGHGRAHSRYDPLVEASLPSCFVVLFNDYSRFFPRIVFSSSFVKRERT